MSQDNATTGHGQLDRFLHFYKIVRRCREVTSNAWTPSPRQQIAQANSVTIGQFGIHSYGEYGQDGQTSDGKE